MRSAHTCVALRSHDPILIDAQGPTRNLANMGGSPQRRTTLYKYIQLWNQPTRSLLSFVSRFMTTRGFITDFDDGHKIGLLCLLDLFCSTNILT